MKRNREHIPDVTASTAAANVAGDSLLLAVLSRIEDELDRVVLLAHVGLDVSLPNLARDLKMERRELAVRVDRIITQLREDTQLAAAIGDVQRAGQPEHYQALAFRLNLQHWFCAQCMRPMVPTEIGRPRITCSPRCRRLRFQAGAMGWREQYLRKDSPPTRNQLQTASDVTAARRKLAELMKPIELARPETFWTQADSQSRDQALLLLGFMCPIPLSISDLALLDVDDVHQNRDGLRSQLYRRTTRGIRYVTVPPDPEPVLNPVRAMLGWRGRLVRSGRRAGPLFIRMDRDGRLPKSTVRLSSRAIANVIDQAVYWSMRVEAPDLKPSMPLPEFLNRMSVAS